MTVAEVIEKMGCMHDLVVLQPWEPCGYRWHLRPEYGASRGRWLKNELAGEGGALYRLCEVVRQGSESRMQEETRGAVAETSGMMLLV
jgi:hypothetical protein